MWASWGLPLLSAAGVFGVLAGVANLTRTLGGGKPSPEARESREKAASAKQQPAADSGAAEEPEPDMALNEALDEPEPDMALAEALDEPEPDTAIAEALDEPEPDTAIAEALDEPEPDTAIAEALDELEPENLTDLVRALQEMGRHGDALEVLARMAELKEGDYREDMAQALRRMRRQLRPEPSANT